MITYCNSGCANILFNSWLWLRVTDNLIWSYRGFVQYILSIMCVKLLNCSLGWLFIWLHVLQIFPWFEIRCRYEITCFSIWQSGWPPGQTPMHLTSLMVCSVYSGIIWHQLRKYSQNKFNTSFNFIIDIFVTGWTEEVVEVDTLA